MRPALIGIGLALALVTSPATAAPRAMAPADQVDGKRVDAYPALWWQWVNRKRWGAQAFQDPTGAQCALNQSGPVWFLAGTDGTDEVRRRCRVPSGKHVFLPLITMLASAAPGKPRTCDEVKADSARNNGHALAVEISVDGVRIELAGLRMASACFNAYEKADYLESTEGYLPSATDGYWLMLAPMADGKHVLKVSVRYDNPGAELGDLEQVFQYDLDVGGSDPVPKPDEDDRDEPAPPWREA